MTPESEDPIPPPSRPMLPRRFVERERRRRYVAAAADLAHELGPEGVTVGLLCRRTRTARTSFYDVFSNRHDCLRYGVGEARERLFAPVLGRRPGSTWVLDLDHALGTFFGAVAEHPNLAELLLVHSFSLGLGSDSQGVEGVVADLSAIVGKGRGAGSGTAPSPGPLSDEAFACATLSVASQALLRGEADELPGRTREVVSLIASAYLSVSEVAPILPRR